ncbi:MAG: hypothetical protein HKN16_08925 [Saprospiraceae bacterium]|nr:hypothetical protein [Saprospiraceae bacterium]
MPNKKKAQGGLIQGEDYYLEKGLFVFTENYHLKRGYCCESKCRHCPYQDWGKKDQSRNL